MNAIKLEGLRKDYYIQGNVKTALNGVDLAIPKGIIFGLLGPNGAGKSTIINIISGIIQATSGNVFVMGKDFIKEQNFCKQQIGTAIQEVVLDPFFSVEEYLTFIAGYYGLSGKKAKERIHSVCESLSLTPHLKKNTRMLSGGMKRRLIVAKAIIHNPSIIILDEPTAGVDIELRNSLWSFMLKLNKEEGKTIILTTHYLKEAEDFCDRIGFINNGNIILEDTKTKILKKINSKTIVFKVEGNINFELPDGVTFKNGELKIMFNEVNFDLTMLLQQIAQSNVKVLDILTKETTLDDIFLSLFK